MKLRPKDLAAYRLEMLKKQGFQCPLCLNQIAPEEACLDHDHDTGHIRFVLHRSCNSAEGRILSWAKRSRADDKYEFLKNLYDMHRKDYRSNPIHPTYLTPNEKEIKKLKKHQKKLKTQRGRDKVQVKIDALMAMEDRE